MIKRIVIEIYEDDSINVYSDADPEGGPLPQTIEYLKRVASFPEGRITTDYYSWLPEWMRAGR